MRHAASSCYAHSSGKYAVKHNPWPYFRAGHKNCAKFDVPMGTPRRGALARDIASGHLPNVGMAIPNLCHDAHGCSLGTADRWLQGWLPSLLHSHAFRSGRLAVVVTADEGNRGGRSSVLTVVLHSAHRGGRAATTKLTHYSLTRYLYTSVGAPARRHARHARGLGHAYGLSGLGSPELRRNSQRRAKRSACAVPARERIDCRGPRARSRACLPQGLLDSPKLSSSDVTTGSATTSRGDNLSLTRRPRHG
jgi:hypothetical protein